MRTVLVALSAALLIGSAHAQVNKCEIGGQLTWQSAPCPPGTGVDGSEEAPPDTGDSQPIHPDPLYDLAYRTAQAIDRTYLSYERCMGEEPGGCQQFERRYLNELDPMLGRLQPRLDDLAEHAAARGLVHDRVDQLNEMTQLMQAADSLTRRANQLNR